MTARIIILNGVQKGNTYPLMVDVVIIGRASRDATYEIRLVDDSVSLPHAQLERLENAWVIKDLGSEGGTFVNHVRVREPDGRLLYDGDIIRVGETLAVYHVPRYRRQRERTRVLTPGGSDSRD